MSTYCTVEMMFTDVTAPDDSTLSSWSAVNFSDTGLLVTDYTEGSMASMELNQYVLDGSIYTLDSSEYVAFWSEDVSGLSCRFTSKPTITVEFSEKHTSAGITLAFVDDYPEEATLTWYADGVLLNRKKYDVNKLTYFCKYQSTYDKLVIEFDKTRVPFQRVKLANIIFGTKLSWSDDTIMQGNVVETVDVTSATLEINTASITIVDEDNAFDIENEDGAWKSVQRAQEVHIVEYVNGLEVPCGTFFIDTFSFSDNQATFNMVDSVGMLDRCTFRDGEVYTNKNAGELVEAIFKACGHVKYVIEDTLYDLTVSGYLGVKTCREALQMVCFAVGAIADDSRADSVYVYMPTRKNQSTIGTDRKFSGESKVELDEYVSGVNIEVSTYSLEDKESELFKGVLSGTQTISLSNPCDPGSVTVTGATLITAKTNYIVVNANGGEVVISGVKYKSDKQNYSKNVNRIEVGESENVKSFTGVTLVGSNMEEVLGKLLDYYTLRKTLSMRIILNDEYAGDWVTVKNVKGSASYTMIESQDIDLVGGFLSTLTCRGYSQVVTSYLYTGELYAGEEW